jgi:hypothetical protein
MLALVAVASCACGRTSKGPPGGAAIARLVLPERVPEGVPLPPAELRLTLDSATVMSGSTSGLMLEFSARPDGGPAYRVAVDIPSCPRFAIHEVARDRYEARTAPLPFAITMEDYRDARSKFDAPLRPGVAIDQDWVADGTHQGWRTVRSTNVRIDLRSFAVTGDRLSARMTVDADLDYGGEEHATPARNVSLEIDVRDAPLELTLVD